MTRESESLVFFSVPFDEGWSATVNGKPAEIEKVNAGFMAVAVPAGASEIRFEYRTPGLEAGLKITGGAALAAVIYIIVLLLSGKRKKAETFYPEGKMLLEKWMVQDREEAELILSTAITDSAPKSILDDYPEGGSGPDIPHMESGFSGGFSIDTRLFDEKGDKED